MTKPDPKDRLRWVHDAKTVDELTERYDAWAEDYEEDLTMYGGKRMTNIMSDLVQRHINPGTGTILDAGAGTGKLGDLIIPFGHNDLIGIDISENMLKLARKKGTYKHLEKMILGEDLNFGTNTFSHFVATVVFREIHIPSKAFDELIRVTKPGGLGIFVICDIINGASPYIDKQNALEKEGKWKLIEASDPFAGGDLKHGGGVYGSFVYQIT
jgi:ubiquinone/menaquinone biosynthesis C-methylase UbiE